MGSEKRAGYRGGVSHVARHSHARISCVEIASMSGQLAHAGAASAYSCRWAIQANR